MGTAAESLTRRLVDELRGMASLVGAFSLPASVAAWRVPDTLRPLAPIATLPAQMVTPASVGALLGTAAYAEVRAYCSAYPPLSLLVVDSRASLFALIRMLRPRAIAEVGTLFAGTAELMARALWENGEGELHTTDPFGGDRCPPIIATWPSELQSITTFYPLTSMDFFLELDRRRVTLDLVLVDGVHDFEFAMFDLQMAARLLRPGGIIVLDNAELSGPFRAARTFLAENPAWRELGNAIALYSPAEPFNATRASLPGTSFVLLQAPDNLSIGPGPHAWGQRWTEATRVDALVLELPPQVTAGTLFYQLSLRAYADENRYVDELKAIGRLRLDLTGRGSTITHELANPLISDVPPKLGRARFSVEVDLSWQADDGAPPLALLGEPHSLPSGG